MPIRENSVNRSLSMAWGHVELCDVPEPQAEGP